MDLLYEALVLFKNKKMDKCIDKCSSILKDTPLDQAAWTLKMRAMTRKVQIDEMELDAVDGFNETQESMWSEVIATAPRPGTSLRNPTRATTALRRPGTGASRTTTARAVTAGRARTAHTPATARAFLATAQARALRLGTATLIPDNEEVFIQVSRLNLTKYAQDKCVSKPLFEYLFYHEGDYRHAMELSVQAINATKYLDWWWKVALAKCYSIFNLKRDSEQQLRSSIKQHKHIETYLRLARVCTHLDQPTTALDVCREGLESFPADVQLMTEQARLMEAIGDMSQSVKTYRSVAIQDAMNIEAIASIAFHHFYNDQPEIALRYYRRILAMGAYSAEVFNNVALCCTRAQYWDLTLTCYRRALLLATENSVQADIWYNLSHLALCIGDTNLATQCLRLCINTDPCHAAALNNLASLELYRGNKSMSKSLYNAALSADSTLTEASINLKSVEEFNN